MDRRIILSIMRSALGLLIVPLAVLADAAAPAAEGEGGPDVQFLLLAAASGVVGALFFFWLGRKISKR